MTDEEIDEAFGSIDHNWPPWLAVLELVDQEIDDACENSTLEHLTDGDRQFNAGRLHQSLRTRNVLRDRMEAVKGRKPPNSALPRS